MTRPWRYSRLLFRGDSGNVNVSNRNAVPVQRQDNAALIDFMTGSEHQNRPTGPASYHDFWGVWRRLKPSRRWAQFSLRTMLLAVTLISVLLGLLAQPLVEARKERAAIEALRKLRADVSSRTVDTMGRGLLQPVLGSWPYLRATRVSLKGLPVGDDDLAHLKSLRHATRLDLWGTRVTDAGLEHLRGMTSLESLDLSGTAVSDAGLAQLRDLTGIVVLHLRDTRVSDAGLAHLRGMTGLVSLDVFGTQVTYEGLERLEQDLPSGNFTEVRAIDEIKALGGQLITSSTVLEADERQARFHWARDMYLDGSTMSGDAMPHVRYLRSLREARLSHLQLGEQGLAPLAALPALESLEIWLTEIDQIDLMHLGQVESLRELSFHHNQMTDAGLKHLANLPRLQKLEFHQTRVTEEGVSALREALPNCQIQVRMDY